MVRFVCLQVYILLHSAAHSFSAGEPWGSETRSSRAVAHARYKISAAIRVHYLLQQLVSPYLELAQ